MQSHVCIKWDLNFSQYAARTVVFATVFLTKGISVNGGLKSPPFKRFTFTIKMNHDLQWCIMAIWWIKKLKVFGEPDTNGRYQ